MAHKLIVPENPAEFTLGTMGRTSKRASMTPTLKIWASRLAAKAGPQDYVGQLRALYDGIILQWRYVRENGEVIHGTPRSLLSHVLGLDLRAPQADPENVDLDNVPISHHGWGDCDDVSTLVAAGVLALGMRPLFRVNYFEGGAHVSVMAVTPDGRQISVDPVGHPKEEFGWMFAPGTGQYYDLDGRVVNIRDQEKMTASHSTVFMGIPGQQKCASRAGFFCATPVSDDLGPRVLAMDPRAAAMFARGRVLDGTPAIDEHGRSYTYFAGTDLWVSDSLNNGSMGEIDSGFGGSKRDRRRARRKRRRVKRRRAIRRVVAKVADVGARVLSNPAVSMLARSVGVPPGLTSMALKAASKGLERRGGKGLARAFRKNPRRTGAMVARAVKSVVGNPGAGRFTIRQGGRAFSGQPVIAIAGIPGAYFRGDVTVASTPAPGRWYRIQPGDNLLKVSGDAFKLGAGSKRYQVAKMINSSPANAAYFESDNVDNLFPRGKISFSPKWSADPESAVRGEKGSSFAVIWIPADKDDLPPMTEVDETPEVEDEVEETEDIDSEDTPETDEQVDPDNEADVEPGGDSLPEDEDDELDDDEPDDTAEDTDTGQTDDPSDGGEVPKEDKSEDVIPPDDEDDEGEESEESGGSSMVPAIVAVGVGALLARAIAKKRKK